MSLVATASFYDVDNKPMEYHYRANDIDRLLAGLGYHLSEPDEFEPVKTPCFLGANGIIDITKPVHIVITLEEDLK